MRVSSTEAAGLLRLESIRRVKRPERLPAGLSRDEVLVLLAWRLGGVGSSVTAPCREFAELLQWRGVAVDACERNLHVGCEVDGGRQPFPQSWGVLIDRCP